MEHDIARATRLRDVLSSDQKRSEFYSQWVDDLQLKSDGVYAQINEPSKKLYNAKVHYESNRCTKFYFRQPGTKNDAIKCLYNLAGHPNYKDKDILKVFQDYYQHLYTQPVLFNDSQGDSYLPVLELEFRNCF